MQYILNAYGHYENGTLWGICKRRGSAPQIRTSPQRTGRGRRTSCCRSTSWWRPETTWWRTWSLSGYGELHRVRCSPHSELFTVHHRVSCSPQSELFTVHHRVSCSLQGELHRVSCSPQSELFTTEWAVHCSPQGELFTVHHRVSCSPQGELFTIEWAVHHREQWYIRQFRRLRWPAQPFYRSVVLQWWWSHGDSSGPERGAPQSCWCLLMSSDVCLFPFSPHWHLVKVLY